MMKGEYTEDHEDNNHNPFSSSSTNSTPQNATNTHFFQNHPKFLSSPPPFLPPHHYHHPPPPPPPPQHFEDSEITPLKPSPPSKKPKNITPTTSEDGATIEVSRRPRGRPPGSKNKQKPAIVITREPDPAMSPYILELPGGSDLVESLTRYTRRRRTGLCVLTATGAVENVTLKQPSTTTPGGTVTFHGVFEILSLSVCLMTNNTGYTMPFSGGFTISLAGPQGQIVGGKVVGPLVCAGTVYVVATSFNNPSYCRLPLEVGETAVTTQSDRVTGGDGGGEQSSSPVSQGGGDGGDGAGTHMSLYNSNEGIWGPTPLDASRPTHQPPY